MKTLERCNEIFSDGTFSIVPNLFNPLYTIHGLVNSSVFPLAFVLMSDRNQSSYCSVLSSLKNLIPEFNANRITTDFKKATINAYQETFPNIEKQGCFSHLSQALRRKIQSITEIRSLYTVDPEYGRHCRMLPAFAFVNPDYVLLVLLFMGAISPS